METKITATNIYNILPQKLLRQIKTLLALNKKIQQTDLRRQCFTKHHSRTEEANIINHNCKAPLETYRTVRQHCHLYVINMASKSRSKSAKVTGDLSKFSLQTNFNNDKFDLFGITKCQLVTMCHSSK